MIENFKKFFKFVLDKFGFAVVIKDDKIDLVIALDKLSKNSCIRHIYDVGSNNGKYAATFLRRSFPLSKIYAFEANPIHFPYPIGLYNSEFQVCLSNNNDDVVEFFATGSTGDSIYREMTSNYQNVKPVLVNTKTLDSICEEKNLPKPDLIKIDIQGAELQVLVGGRSTLTHTRFLILELSFVEYNFGAPKMFELLSFLAENSFYPVRILELHKIDSVIVQIDLLFERRRHPFK